MGKNRLPYLFLSSTLFLPTTLTADPDREILPGNPLNQRYVINAHSNAEPQPGSKALQTRCVLDKKTLLTWEVKTRDNGLQDTSQTYSWYDPENQSNGGSPGFRRKGTCKLELCDTQSYIDAINSIKLCDRSNWRLPSREELRSLVDYAIAYPGPTIDQSAFPNTVSQFYWSATANADNKETAWGIGFSFGYDYAYFKTDHGHVRLVSGPDK